MIEILLLLCFLLIYLNHDYAKPLKDIQLKTPKCCLLLTMYANTDEKIRMYNFVLNEWLTKTNFDIFTVDSANSEMFKESTNKRWKPFSFLQEKDAFKNSSFLELNSIEKCYNTYQKDFESYDYIFKLTGKYFLPDFENLLKYVKDDIIIQNNIFLTENTFKTRSFNNLLFPNKKQQHCELFGFKPILLADLLNIFDKEFHIDKTYILEKALFQFYSKYSTLRLPKLKPSTSFKRGCGDILQYL